MRALQGGGDNAAIGDMNQASSAGDDAPPSDDVVKWIEEFHVSRGFYRFLSNVDPCDAWISV